MCPTCKKIDTEKIKPLNKTNSRFLILYGFVYKYYMIGNKEKISYYIKCAVYLVIEFFEEY
jgi:hypothetical protein